MTTAQPDWINGSYEDARRMVAERAVYSRSVGGLVKKADVDWQGLLSSPEIQGALIGAGVGGLGGTVMSEHKLRGGLLGALAGAGLGAGAGHVFKSPGTPASPADQRAQEEALNQARDARSALGVLGADEKGVNQAVENYNSQTTLRQIEKTVPGVGEQLRNLPAAVGTAASQGRIGDVLKQVDVLGLKNLVPFSGHFSPGTAAASAGAGLAAKALPYWRPVSDALVKTDLHTGRLGRLLTNEAASKELGTVGQDMVRRLIQNPSLSRGLFNQLGQDELRTLGSARRAMGSGPAPLLASLAPLVYREWLGSGYRSGHQPAMDLTKALETLRKT